MDGPGAAVLDAASRGDVAAVQAWFAAGERDVNQLFLTYYDDTQIGAVHVDFT